MAVASVPANATATGAVCQPERSGGRDRLAAVAWGAVRSTRTVTVTAKAVGGESWEAVQVCWWTPSVANVRVVQPARSASSGLTRQLSVAGCADHPPHPPGTPSQRGVTVGTAPAARS